MFYVTLTKALPLFKDTFYIRSTAYRLLVNLVAKKPNKIDDSKLVGRFLQLKQSESTKASYKSHLKKFFDFVGQDPDDYIDVDFELLENGDRVRKRRKYERDIEDFFIMLCDNDTPPTSMQSTLFAVKSLLQKYNIELSKSFFKQLNMPKARPVTRTIPITHEMLQNILEHADIKGKALFLMLSSGGMRVGEALSITPDDVDYDHKPTKIFISAKASKNNVERITSISDEATLYLKKWLQERDQYLQNTLDRLKKAGLPEFRNKKKNDKRIFPFAKNNANEIWNRLVKKAGYYEKDKNTSRTKVRIHGLRAFFRTNLGDVDLAEDLMGHEGYLSNYRQIDDKSKSDAYNKYVKNLIIFNHVDTKEQQKLINQMEERIKELEETMEGFSDYTKDSLSAINQYEKTKPTSPTVPNE